jgi:hypothetical protein
MTKFIKIKNKIPPSMYRYKVSSGEEFLVEALNL